MTAAPKTSVMTPEEFLRWEETQHERHELVDGEIFTMVGATLEHERIVGNIEFALRTQLRVRGCEAFSKSTQVLAGRHVFYPDVAVECGAPAHGRVLEKPVLIVEVLSESTEVYDRTTKWELYRRNLASLRTFVLVAQDRLAVEVFRRTRDGWNFGEHTGADDVVELGEPPCRLTLADIYGMYFEEYRAAAASASLT